MIDLSDKAFVLNPYPELANLRRQGKPVWHPELNLFLAARYKDASQVLRDRKLGRIFQPKQPNDIWETFNWLHADSILDSEPPKHSRLRSLVMKAFNPKVIAELEPTIRRIALTLIAESKQKLEASGHFDLIADFAEPLPVKVIAHLLGFPESDEHLLRPWSQAIVKMYEVSPSEQEQLAAQQASEQFAQYVQHLMVERQLKPGTDLISDLARVEQDGEKLNAHELIATCVLLLNAGHEASVNGFGNGMVATLRNPEQLDLLKTNPDSIAGTAVDEFLRFDSPLHLFERTATEDTVIGGVDVKAGQKIAALLGSANHDEEVFDRPTELDLTRSPNPHIGFGAGIHFCIGAPLARLEMATALPELIRAFPKIKLWDEPVLRDTFVLRGYESVLVSA
jgi:cytochrome P450